MNLTSKKLFAFQLIAHIFTIYWVFSDYFSLRNALYVFLIYFFTGCIGMSITYHRLLTHRSFTTSKFFEYFGTICATVGLTGSSLSWTAAHRLHHTKSDKNNDPHSPKILGYIRAQWLSMFSEINIKKSPVLKDKFHITVHRHYILINVFWASMIFLLFGFEYLLVLYLVPACLLWNSGSLINTVCHTKFLGYRRHNTPDNSVNNPLLGIFMWGEGWHNNHHRFQNKSKIGEKWYEIDIGYYIIKLIER